VAIGIAGGGQPGECLGVGLTVYAGYDSLQTKLGASFMGVAFTVVL
jgi:hypothetical protein